jgi:hypothetical protein
LSTSKLRSSIASASSPERAADFIGSLGVNTHIGQVGYAAKTVMADLAYLGLGKVRDHAIGPKTTAAHAAALGDLANAGIKFDWLAGGALAPTLADLNTFLSAHPGAISTIEGPNEVNNFPISFGGLTGAAAAQAYQLTLDQDVKADLPSTSIPVLDLTGAAQVAGSADAANAHVYPGAGEQPSSAVGQAVRLLQAAMPGEAAYITEAGYSTLSGMPGGVDDATQAKLTLNLIMDATSLGVSSTYLYDLIDDGPDPTGKVLADHFGLFTTTGLAKPSAVAIHNLTSILADTGASAQSFIPTALNYTITGLPASGLSLVIEKSSGVYDLVVWAEPDIWNPTTHAAIAAPTESVTVNFPTKAVQVSVFDPLASASPIATSSNTSAVTVGVSDHPVIIQVSGFAQAMASLGASTAGAVVGVSAASSPSAGAATLLAHPSS